MQASTEQGLIIVDNQEKLKTAKQASFVLNRKEGPFESAKQTMERLKARDLSPDEIEQLQKSLSRFVEVAERTKADEQNFLQSRQFPPDVVQAVRVAMADLFGEFVTADEIEEYNMSKIWELLQTAFDRRQWLAKKTPAVFALESFDVEFVNTCEAGDDTELTDDESAAFEKLVNHFFTMFEHDIPNRELLAYWWWYFLRGPLRNVRIGTDEFRRSRAGLISVSVIYDVARQAGIDRNSLGNFSLIELLEAMMSAREDAEEKAPPKMTGAASRKPKAEKNATIKASQLDRDRVAFLQKLKRQNERTTQKEAANRWAKLHKDECDEQGIRNAVYRVKNHGKRKDEHNKT